MKKLEKGKNLFFIATNSISNHELELLFYVKHIIELYNIRNLVFKPRIYYEYNKSHCFPIRNLNFFLFSKNKLMKIRNSGSG